MTTRLKKKISNIQQEDIWPPDYPLISKNRIIMLNKISKNEELIRGAILHCKSNPIDFIQDWCITYDPRNAFKQLPTTLPFILFKRQKEMVEFILSCLNEQACGLIEKSRDMGATWICCALSVWMWLFTTGASIGWGSRKELLVDRLGDPDSIFEKIRMIINHLPFWMLPNGFNDKEHSLFMRIINPENGATITGESGDNIGRGGRKLIMFKDESAHYERPEKIEAALSETTNCQIDMSSVHGVGTVFHRKRESGEVWYPGIQINKNVIRVFIMDWRDHPLKTQEWYDDKKAKYETEGIPDIFAQEVDRDYASSIENTIIKTKWIEAAIDAHKALNLEIDGLPVCALDVADEGGDKNALAIRKGVLLQYLESWSMGDTSDTAKKTVAICNEKKLNEFYYDCVGVGSGVKGKVNELRKSGLVRSSLTIFPWNGGAKVLNPNKRVIPDDPESPKNKDFYKNLKAQGWWSLRNRFENTYNAVVKKEKVDLTNIICIPSDIDCLYEIKKELTQPTFSRDMNMRIVVDKKPNGAKSPNKADAVMMAFHPAKGIIAKSCR